MTAYFKKFIYERKIVTDVIGGIQQIRTAEEYELPDFYGVYGIDKDDLPIHVADFTEEKYAEQYCSLQNELLASKNIYNSIK